MLAQLLISKSEGILKEKIQKILIESGLKNSHPDVLYFPIDSKLGILEARKIKEHFSLKPYSAKGRVVVMEDATNLTVDAQNALLKTLEELPDEGIIIMGADSEAKLLPTVLSRCQVVRLHSSVIASYAKQSQDIEKLLTATIEERFEYIEKLKDRQEFLKALISYFHSTLPSHNDFVKELLTAEEWTKSNVNIRGILEYLMLKMPVL